MKTQQAPLSANPAGDQMVRICTMYIGMGDLLILAIQKGHKDKQ